MININFGHNKALLDACKPLKEYAWFVDKVRSYQQTMETLEEAVDAALEELPDDSLIKPVLVANKAEVKRMCITEYDEARTFAEQRDEGREEGVLATLISLVKDGILTVVDAAKRANMTVDDFEAKTGLKA